MRKLLLSLTMLMAGAMAVWAQTPVVSIAKIGEAPCMLSDEDAAKIFELDDLTIAVLVEPTSVSGRMALFATSDPTKEVNSGAEGKNSRYVAYGMNGADAGYLASWRSGDRFTGGGGITAGEENIIVYVINPTNNTFKAYVNGKEMYSKVDAHDDGFMAGYEIATPKMVKTANSGAKIYIGGGMSSSGAGEVFKGTIRSVKVYSGALTAEEIAAAVPEVGEYHLQAWKESALSLLGCVGGYPENLREAINAVNTYSGIADFEKEHANDKLQLTTGAYYRLVCVAPKTGNKGDTSYNTLTWNGESHLVTSPMDMENDNQVFMFEDAGDSKYYLKSVIAGKYLDKIAAGNYRSQVVVKESACKVNVVSYAVAGQFKLNNSEGATNHCLFAENNPGENVPYACAGWDNGANSASAWCLVSVEPIAQVGEQTFYTFDEAITAAQNGETVTMLVDINLTETVTIPAGKAITLDLNGKTVTMVYAQDATANHTMINNLGDLTIKSSVEGGKLSYTYTGKNLGTTYAANTITSEPGSVLTVKSGTIENLTFDSGVIAYAIDGRTNGGAGDVTVNIEGGVITSKRQAVRIFANSTTNTGNLNISGGEFTGRVIVQNASANPNKATLNITGGTFNANEYKSDVLYLGGSNSATIEIDATVSGGTFNGEITDTNVAGFISGGTFTTDVNEYCAEGYELGADGTVKAKPVAEVNGVKYATLAEAVAAAQADDVIVLTADVKTTDGVVITDKNLTIDLNGKTYTVTEGASTNNRNFKINGTSVVTVKNGTMVAAGEYSSGAYGTIRTEGTANVTLTGLKLYNYRGNGLNIKACAGTTVTIENTEIYANYGGGIESAGGTIVVNNGVTVEQKGMYTAPYNSMAISVNGGGKVTVNGGTFSTECITAEEANNQGTSHGPWVAGVLNSGGTLIINGGTFSNDNFGENSLATAARGAILADTKAKVEINGGTFNVLKNVIDIQNNLGDTNNNPSVLLVGGTYSADPRISAQYGSNLITLAEDYIAVENNGVWNVVKAAAKIDEQGYATIKDAVVAAQNGETITMLADVNLTETVTIPAGKTITLDLNGKTITGTDNATGSYGLININSGAELTINDATGNGAIKLTATNNREWNAYSSVISNQRGKLTVNGGTIEHLGGTDMAYAIDNLTNGKGTYAETIINGGVIKSTYRAIRQFLNGTEAQNILTVNGGTIEGTNKSIWMQDPSKNANSGTLTVAEGAVIKGDVYLFVTAGSTEWPVSVSIAAAALQGESKVVTGNVPAGYELANVNGTYGVIVNPNYLAEFAINESVNYTNEQTKTVGTLTYTRTLSTANTWMPLYVPFEIPVEMLGDNYEVARFHAYHETTDANGYVVDGSAYVELVKITEGTLLANYPYLIKAKNDEACQITLELTKATLYGTKDSNRRIVTCSSATHNFAFSGTYEEADRAKLGYEAGKTVCYAMSDGTLAAMSEKATLGAYRIYMTSTVKDDAYYVSAPAARAIALRVIGEESTDGTTVIYDVEADDQTADSIYDLQGRRVQEPQKGGLYIVNGKKVIF